MDSANLSTKCQWIADLARHTILDQRVTDGYAVASEALP